MWIAPFVRSESSHNEQREADDQIGDEHVDPDLEAEEEDDENVEERLRRQASSEYDAPGWTTPHVELT